MEQRRDASRLEWVVPTLASFCAVCALGCGSGSGGGSTVNSQTLETDEIEADIDVFAREPGRIVVEADVEHENVLQSIVDVELSTDDAIRVTTPNGDTGRLKRSKSSSGPRYRAEFDTTPTEGRVRICFRDMHFDVDLRPEFSVTSPTPGNVFGFQDDLRIAWTPAEPGSVIQIWFDRSCRATTGEMRRRSS
jgi:hypothetical protein